MRENMKKPRILYLSALPLGVGGIETHLLGLLEAVALQYETFLFAPAQSSFTKDALARKCQVSFWQVEKTGDIRAWFTLFFFLRKVRPDIVHVHDARAASILRPLAALFFNFPIINTVHLPPYYYQFEGKTARLRARVYSIVEKFLNRTMTTKIIYVGKHVYEEALALGYARLAQAELVENGIDLTPFRIDYTHRRKMLRTQTKTPLDMPVFVCVARLSSQKRQDVLLHAAAILKKNGMVFHLWLVGEGPERVALEQLSQELSLSDIVIFHGSRTDIPALLAASDVFVLLSDYEGRTLSVMEAQAAGLPCILSNVGDHPFMVQEGETGFIVPPRSPSAAAQAMQKMLTSVPQRIEMGEKAKKYAFTHFDKELQHKQSLNIYAALLEENGTIFSHSRE